MLQVKKDGILLEKTDHIFENEGVLNPAAIGEGDFVHLFYRAVGKGNHSSIGYCRLNGPLEVEYRMSEPLLVPEFEYESHGMEDPRIVKIEDLYYLTYTAYDGVNALGALAISKDLIHFEKKGIIVPKITYEDFNRLAETKDVIDKKYYCFNQHNNIIEKIGLKMMMWDKDVVFFPRKINGKFCFLHRIRPEIQIVVQLDSLEDLSKEYWQKYLINLKDNIVLEPNYNQGISYVGGGCPPIETEFGWLVIYHRVITSLEGYFYSACAALLDIDNPQIEVARLPYDLFKPEEIWELKGEVNNVCFPTGTAVFDGVLYIYYGAADVRIACASMSLSELLKELMLNKKQDEK